MAFNIPMSLVENCDDRVVYEYYDDIWERDRTKPPFSKERMKRVGRRVGRVMLDKRTQEFTQLAGQDWDENEIFFSRACMMMARQFENDIWPKEMAYQA
jgi:hypothetical protein